MTLVEAYSSARAIVSFTAIRSGVIPVMRIKRGIADGLLGDRKKEVIKK